MKRPIVIPLGLFLVACALPCLQMKTEALYGGVILLMGWMGMFAGVWGWFANPLFLLGLLFGALGKRVPAMVFGALAVLVALTVFGSVGKELPGDEGGVTKTAIVGLMPGAYLWLLGVILLPVTGYFVKGREVVVAPPPFAGGGR